jgi:pSer/pThr/pTyr-binding forkhead associated (FHA) protein
VSLAASGIVRVVTALYCNRCGQPAPTGAAHCAVCFAVLDGRGDQTTDKGVHAVVAALADLSRGQLEAVAADRPVDAGMLVVARGPNLGARFELRGEITRVGRDAAADICLDDITVSRRHCEVCRGDPDYVLVDLDSLNGTYWNGARVDRAGLRDGDQIQVGRFKLLFFTPVSLSTPEAR